MASLARIALALLLVLAGPSAFAAGAVCGGVDRIAELRTARPEKYAAFERDAKAVPNAEGLLWRITAANGSVSHLFGTMHASEPDLVALADPVRAALGEAKAVAVEIADATGPTVQAATVAYVTKNGVDFSGKGLEGLSRDEAELVKRRLSEAGMPSQIAAMLKPWFLGLTLGMPACQLRQVSAGKPTVDGEVERTGRAQGAKIVSLESVEEQLDAASKVSEETARKIIRDAVAEPKASEDLQATTIALYRARTVGWYFAMKGDVFGKALDVSAHADFLDEIVNRRNALMLERSRPLLAAGGAFIAVGALHLPGEQGLVELIRKDGHTVEKVW